MKAIREKYGVPAKRGRWVEVYTNYRGCWRLATHGKIWQASEDRLWIAGGCEFHPTQNVVYYDRERGNVLMDTRKESP